MCNGVIDLIHRQCTVCRCTICEFRRSCLTLNVGHKKISFPNFATESVVLDPSPNYFFLRNFSQNCATKFPQPVV